MKKIFLFLLLNLMAYNCPLLKAQNKVFSEQIEMADQIFLSGNYQEAKKIYKKALKNKDNNVKILACYRIKEVAILSGREAESAYELAFCDATLKRIAKKQNKSVVTRDEFYTINSIEPLHQLMAIKNNVAGTSNRQSPNTTTDKDHEKPIILTKSDIDINIPQGKNKNADKTFVVIIANENYQEVEKVPFTINDGETFKLYCNQTLGIPESNISLIKDATANNIKREISWLTQILEKYNGEAKGILYYAGHGIPDVKSKDAYLLPVDGYGDDPSTGYSLNKLYTTLNSVPSSSIYVFIDACFSGANRDGGMLASSRGVAIKTKTCVPTGNVIAFSAAQGDETAYPYTEKNHGLFTYYFLKKLQETKGDVTLGELCEYVIDQVGKQSIIINRKSQTPKVSVSSSLIDNWKNIKIK